ncbi:MAG: hypothetical protein EOP84_00810 [Verrucomicrobiaceae bacterium]|nr:MAG: hypothetical protein EOP84_00810 [Verrucomicrobiaceae bacterium]
MPAARRRLPTASPAEDRVIPLGHGLAAIPERLLLSHARGEVLFVAGAGVSMPSLPDFRGLVLNVYRRLDGPMFNELNALAANATWPVPLPLNDEQKAEARRFISADYDVVLGMLERRMDRQGSGSQVRQAVADEIAAVTTPTPIHSTLVKLARRQICSAIITTNFDLLFQEAAKRRKSVIPTFALGAIARPSRDDLHGVLHIHGALGKPGPASEFILSDRDFGEHYFRRRSIPDFIYDAARLFNLVLVGYSANDPPMRYLLNAVAADSSRFDDLKERFTFVGGAAPDPVATEDWRARGITPVHYDVVGGNHSVLNSSLARWAELSVHNGPPHLVDREIKRIVRGSRASVVDRDRDLFDHLYRRAGLQERLRMAALIPKASYDWLDAMMEIALEDGPGVIA